jgi:hypothetical protein
VNARPHPNKPSRPAPPANLHQKDRYRRVVGKGLTVAQRRAVAGSDRATGRVSARADVCAALVGAGLAVRHGRAGHHGCYLTPEGLRVRATLDADAQGVGTEEGTSTPPQDRPAEDRLAQDRPAGGRFVADDGTGTLDAPPARAADVAAAWEGLLQIRSVLGDGATEVPAAWERERPVHAVALALEAAGVPPARPGASPGYLVRASAHPGLAEITWSAPDFAPTALPRVATVLTPLGWQSTEHHTRDGSPYLLISPRHR